MKKTIFLLLLAFTCHAQFLDDKESSSKVLKGLDFLYNQQFPQAEAEFAPVKAKYADHPVRFLLNAIQIQWKHIPIDQNPAALNAYLAELNKCVTASYKYYEKPAYKMESTFFLLAGHGFLALSENYKGNFLDATKEARKALKFFKEGKKYKKENAEFLFANGLYAYYRERYPETKPIVKPIMVFFESGNKAQGLAELEKSFKTSLFSRTEAGMYLRDIYVKYEANFPKALSISGQLFNKFPNNYIIRISHVESLLLNKKYEEAAKLNAVLKNFDNPVAALSYNTFEGYIQEHHERNYAKAKENYLKATKTKPNDRYTKEYLAMAYWGLGRIANQENKKSEAREYYKLCLKNAEYIWLIKEAKNEQKAL